jgi:hypothetical protein
MANSDIEPLSYAKISKSIQFNNNMKIYYFNNYLFTLDVNNKILYILDTSESSGNTNTIIDLNIITTGITGITGNTNTIIDLNVITAAKNMDLLFDPINKDSFYLTFIINESIDTNNLDTNILDTNILDTNNLDTNNNILYYYYKYEIELLKNKSTKLLQTKIKYSEPIKLDYIDDTNYDSLLDIIYNYKNNNVTIYIFNKIIYYEDNNKTDNKTDNKINLLD